MSDLTNLIGSLGGVALVIFALLKFIKNKENEIFRREQEVVNQGIEESQKEIEDAGKKVMESKEALEKLIADFNRNFPSKPNGSGE